MFGDKVWSSVEEYWIEMKNGHSLCRSVSEGLEAGTVLHLYGFWLAYISEKQVFNLYFISKTTGSLKAQLTFNINAPNNRKMILFEFSGPVMLSLLWVEQNLDPQSVAK